MPRKPEEHDAEAHDSVDENVTKREGVLPPQDDPDDVHGFDTRTASPAGSEPIHPDRDDIRGKQSDASKRRRERT